MPLASHIQLRADTSTNFTSADPVLEVNEMGLETDTGRVKLGDGSTVWTSLAYYFEENPWKIKTCTVATVPSAATWVNSLIYVSDETGGAIPAFSDGTNWRRVSDRAIVS